MGPLDFLLLFVLVVGGSVSMFVVRDAWAILRWRISAYRLGWDFHRGALTEGDEIRGKHRGRALCASNESRRRTLISLKVPLSESFALKAEGLSKRRALKTGDPAFDQSVEVSGDSAEVLAHLSHASREVIRRVFEDRKIAHWGTLSVEKQRVVFHSDSVVSGKRKLSYITEAMVEVADAPVPAPVPQRALRTRINNEDELTEHRIRCLDALVQTAPSKLSEVCRAVVKPEYPAWLRLRAAEHLGVTSAIDDFEAIALDSGLKPDVRGRALESLVRHLPSVESIAPTLFKLKAEDPLIAQSAARGMGRLGGERARRALLQMSKGRYRPVVAESLIALVKLEVRAPSPARDEVEQALIRASGLRDSAVVMEAVRGLAQIGSVRAVQVLQPLAKGLFGQLKREAAQAINKIQSRAPHGAGGQLSVFDKPGGEGQLSVSSEGRLSVSSEED